MSKFNFYSIFLAVMIIAVSIYSCGKEAEKTFDLQSEIVELRNGVNPVLGGDLIDLLGTSCVPGTINIGGGCNDTLYVDTLVVTNHVMYPGCSFKIIFQRRECKLGSSFEDVTVGDFQILEHNCPQFSTDLDNTYNQSIWSDYIIDFETEMWNKIRDYLISQKVTGEKFKCTQGVYFNINFIRASCYRCVTTKTRSGGLGVSTKLACGSQCCERHTRVCRQLDGTLKIVQTDVTNPFNITCSGSSFLTDPPIWLGHIEWQTPCMVTCPN